MANKCNMLAPIVLLQFYAKRPHAAFDIKITFSIWKCNIDVVPHVFLEEAVGLAIPFTVVRLAQSRIAGNQVIVSEHHLGSVFCPLQI